jgi:hypothetical protein
MHIPKAKRIKMPHSISVGILFLYLIAISFLLLGAGTAGLPAAVCGLVTLIVATTLAVMNGQAKTVGVRIKHADPTVVLTRVHPAAAQVLVNSGIAARVGRTGRRLLSSQSLLRRVADRLESREPPRHFGET